MTEENSPTKTTGMAESELRARIFRLVVENVPLMLWAVDPQGVFLVHEGKGLESVGVKPGQFLGANIFEVHGGNEGVVSAVRRAIAGELVHGFASAGGFEFESWQMPLRDGQGEITACVGVTIDISAMKSVENDLRTRLAQIEHQQLVIRQLSTPIIEVWDHVLTLPLMGAVDSERVGEVMQSLLNEVARKRARYAILDLTGVEVVDSGTAAHLINLVRSLRLLGAEGMITGIQPVVAETMVTLGLSLEGIMTAANLREGLKYCIEQMEAA
jgi:rsbT co-antagonist protein RsbR